VATGSTHCKAETASRNPSSRKTPWGMSGSFIWVRSEFLKESLCSGAPWSQHVELCRRWWIGKWRRQGDHFKNKFLAAVLV